MTSTKIPIVSIGMAVRNCEHTVANAIRSILWQSFTEWELILIDDGSTDRTSELSRQFVDARIRVLDGRARRGISAQLNYAIEISRGKYFARMDGDDVSYPERLALQLRFLEDRPEIDLLGGGILVFGADGNPLGTRYIAETHGQICRRPWTGFYIPHPTWMGRTSWFRENPYRSDAVRCEDQDLLLRTHTNSKFACLPTIVLGYQESSLSLKKLLRARKSFCKSICREYLPRKKYGRALRGVVGQCLKATVDLIAISTGLNYKILRHRALPIETEKRRRWIELWASLQNLARAASAPADSTELKNIAMLQSSPRPSILYAVTSPMLVQWGMRGQLRYLRDAGFDVSVIAAPGAGLTDACAAEGACGISLPIAREISPLQDLVSLWRIWKVMQKVRPVITNAGSPKAGLLAGIAAWLARVPCRIYTQHSLRFETTVGLKRWLLIFTERIACGCADQVICVSESLRQKAIRMRIVPEERTVVLGAGTSNGVDTKRFAFSIDLLRKATQLRHRLGIAPEALVIGFVGRITRDKGISELVSAFDALAPRFPALRLLLVGDHEDGDPIAPALRERIETDPKIICSGFIQDTEIYYQAMSLLVLPSHREGFGNVILEAGAAGKPVVATSATGIVDAVVNGVTGILTPVGDSAALADAIAQILGNPDLARSMGEAGRIRVIRDFESDQVWNSLSQVYARLLNKNKLTMPQALSDHTTGDLGVNARKTGF